VFYSYFRTNLDTGTTFDAIVDVNRDRLAVLNLVDIRRTLVCAVAVPDAFVVIHFNGDRIALPCFYRHFSDLLIQDFFLSQRSLSSQR
jgi:hypothetical protein